MMHTAAAVARTSYLPRNPGHGTAERWRAVVCAGVISNYLRRSQGRSIDVAWLLCDPAYARHIIYLARQSGEPAMLQYALRLEAVLSGTM